MSWNNIGRFGQFLRMFGDMQTGLKKSFRCRKDQNSATNPCDSRAVISLIVTHYQAQFTEIIRFGSVCAHTCREMSIAGGQRPELASRSAAGPLSVFVTGACGSLVPSKMRKAMRLSSNRREKYRVTTWKTSQSLSFHSAGKCLRGKRNWVLSTGHKLCLVFVAIAV